MANTNLAFVFEQGQLVRTVWVVQSEAQEDTKAAYGGFRLT